MTTILFRFSLCLFVFLVEFSGASFGALFYSNFTTPSSGAGYVGYESSMGTRRATFAGYTGETTWQLSYVELNINKISGESDDLKVFLYEGISPVTQIAELSASVPVDDQADYSFYPSDVIYLTPNTFYSIVVEPAFVDGTWFAWHYAPDEYGTDYSEATGTTWGPWINGEDAPSVRVYGGVVPEPTTGALFGLGGLICFWRVKRQAKRIQKMP